MPRIHARLGTAAFLLASAIVVANLLLFQPVPGPQTHGLRTAAAAQAGRVQMARPAGARAVSPPREEAEAIPVADGGHRPAPADLGLSPSGIADSRTGAGGSARDRGAGGNLPGTEGGDVVRAVQRELKERGYESGMPDGNAGLMTRAAIMAFEHDHGLALTAEPSPQLLKLILMGGFERRQAADAVMGREQSVQATQVIRTVQQSLVTLGYALGRVDGRLGEDTVRAIRDFEIDQGLAETGRVSGLLVARLSRLAGQGRMASGAKP